MRNPESTIERWKGVCVEPQPKKFFKDRHCVVAARALSDRGGQKAKALYSYEGSTNWNISGNVVENNGGPNFVWMSGCRDTAINNSWSSNFYSCKSVSGKVLGPHGRTSECCDSECS